MALIVKNKESASQRWYKKNKQRRSEERKKRYAEDPDYRQGRVEYSRRYRRGERSLPTPPDAPISFAGAAKRIGIDESTLHSWRSKKYFPEPKHHNGRRLWFSEKQVLLLKDLKEFLRVYGKRRGNMKQGPLKELRASISTNWG